MRFTGLLCILAPLTFAVLTTAGRADDLGVATAAPAVPAVPATAAAPAPTAPAAASESQAPMRGQARHRQ